jgi:hypothetical protein
MGDGRGRGAIPICLFFLQVLCLRLAAPIVEM